MSRRPVLTADHPRQPLEADNRSAPEPAGLGRPGVAALIRARDPGTIDAVANAYLVQLLRAARAAGLGAADAEDVTQATFVTFLEKAPSFEGRSHVRTWLFGILYKKIAESRRRSASAQKVDSIDAVLEGRFDARGAWSRPPKLPDSDLESQEIGEAISRCLQEAPDKQRMAFVLREVQGMPTAEICKILDVTTTNLGVLLHRVRNRLRECLESGGVRGPR